MGEGAPPGTPHALQTLPPSAHPVASAGTQGPRAVRGLPALSLSGPLSLSLSLSFSLSLSLLPGEGGEGGGASGLVLFAGLEGHLQHALAQAVAIEAGDGHGRLVVVGHGDEAEALALVGGEVTDDLDVGDRPEGPEQLPQNALVRFRRQVVHEDAPAGARCTPRKAHARKAAHAIDGDG